MYISFESALAGLDCCTVLVWWLVGYEILPRFHWLVLPALWLADLNIDWETRRLHWILGNYGLTWPMGISPVFQTPLTVPLHSPNGREMPVVRSVQGDCETVYAGSYLLSALGIVLLQGLLCGLWIFTLRCYEERPYIITLMVYWIPGIGSWKILQWRRVSVMTSAITTNPMHGPLARYAKLRVRMRRECRERFPRHRGWAIPTCITARASRTCRDAFRDR